MTVEFEYAGYGPTTTQYAVRWYDVATNAMELETLFNSTAALPVSGTSPQRYRISGIGPKPATPAGKTYAIKVAGKNTIGYGPESAPSASFTISAPATAPANVTVTTPEA